MDRVHRICRQSNGGHGSTGSAFTKNNVEEITIAAIAAIPRPHPAPRGGAHRVGSGGVSSTQVRSTQLDKTWRLRVEVKAGLVIGVQTPTGQSPIPNQLSEDFITGWTYWYNEVFAEKR